MLLNAPPMPSTAGRSFNFNKLRAMLLSRAVVGVQLDRPTPLEGIFLYKEFRLIRDFPL